MKIVLLGAPGVGKGTIADLMIENMKLVHISTGNLFREAISKNDPLSVQLKSILNSGGLVSDDITNQIAKNAIDECIKNNKGFILDGYPRTIEQAKYLDSIVDIDYVFCLNADMDSLLNRITGRRICPNCNAIYNVHTNMKSKVEDICDDCGSILIQRKDDSIETAKKRIDVYNELTNPIIDYYDSTGKLSNINALQNVNDIYEDILKICQNKK